MRQFRVAFIELMCRMANISEAEDIEMRAFGAPNTVARLEEDRQENRGPGQENMEQANVNNNNTDNSNGELPKHGNYVLKQENNNWVGNMSITVIVYKNVENFMHYFIYFIHLFHFILFYFISKIFPLAVRKNH